MNQAETPRVPKHIGLILDGNRRWAKQRGLPTLEGHRKGYNRLKQIAEEAFDNGVEYVSAYIFSTENWKREQNEVDYLMDLALRMFNVDLKKMHKKGFRIRWLGVPDKLSQKLIDAIRVSEELTRNNTKGQLCLCFNYGGQQEIADAVKRIKADESITAGDITPELIRGYLQHPDIPDVDLMIRTSGEQRISNFMLWRVSYAELLFVKKHFPAFSKKDLLNAIDDYRGRERRFGGNKK